MAENEYACASLRISAAASWRFDSWFAISVSADLRATADASGSCLAARAAFRSAWAPACVRGIAAWAEAIASEACASHFDAPSLYAPSLKVAFARSALQVRNASAPWPFHSTSCGRTLSSSAILRISFAALTSRSDAPWTAPLFAWSSHASMDSCDMPSNGVPCPASL
ncbi:MAG TPA: hypothetical protein VIS29_03810 [Streptomyces sp.]